MGEIQPVIGHGAGSIRACGDLRAERDVLRSELAGLRIQVDALLSAIRNLAADAPEIGDALDRLMAALAALRAAGDSGHLARADAAADQAVVAVQALQHLARLRNHSPVTPDA